MLLFRTGAMLLTSLVLLIASFIKLTSVELAFPNRGHEISEIALTTLTIFELSVAIWLLSFKHVLHALLVTLTLFVSFAFVSWNKWALDVDSCGCFGPVNVSPEIVFFMDLTICVLVITALIITFRLKEARLQIFPDPTFSLRFVVLYLLLFSVLAMLNAGPFIDSQIRANRATDESLSNLNSNDFLELESILAKFQPSDSKRKLLSRTPSKLLIVLTRAECLNCKIFTKSIMDTVELLPCEVVIGELPGSDGVGESVNPFNRKSYPYRLQSRQVDWSLPTPMLLFYLNSRPVSSQTNAKTYR